MKGDLLVRFLRLHYLRLPFFAVAAALYQPNRVILSKLSSSNLRTREYVFSTFQQTIVELSHLCMRLLQSDEYFMQFSELGTKIVSISAFGRWAYGVVCKWAMMFTGCCLKLPCSNGDESADMVCPEESRRLRKVFEMCDANRDGFLTLEELCLWMKKLGRPMTRAGLSRLLQSCDWNNDGRLDFHEFAALTQTLHNDFNSDAASNNCIHTRDGDEGEDDPKYAMKEAFQVFDKDGNGLISPSELRATLCELGLLSSPCCLSRIHSMIKRVDVDGDGQVSFSEFETMMNGK